MRDTQDAHVTCVVRHFTRSEPADIEVAEIVKTGMIVSL
jgi:hypothetical protein